MTRAHNDSNLPCLSGKITEAKEAKEALAIVDDQFDTPFEGGRYHLSLELIRQAGETLLNRAKWNPFPR